MFAKVKFKLLEAREGYAEGFLHLMTRDGVDFAISGCRFTTTSRRLLAKSKKFPASFFRPPLFFWKKRKRKTNGNHCLSAFRSITVERMLEWRAHARPLLSNAEPFPTPSSLPHPLALGMWDQKEVSGTPQKEDIMRGQPREILTRARG